MKEVLRLEPAPDRRNGARLTLTDVSTFRGTPRVAGHVRRRTAGSSAGVEAPAELRKAARCIEKALMAQGIGYRDEGVRSLVPPR